MADFSKHAIATPQGFVVTNNDPIDCRTYLTAEEMYAISCRSEEKRFFPDHYLVYGVGGEVDGGIYYFNKSTTYESPLTGKFERLDFSKISSYVDLDDKPSINGVELNGDVSDVDLHIQHVMSAMKPIFISSENVIFLEYDSEKLGITSEGKLTVAPSGLEGLIKKLQGELDSERHFRILGDSELEEEIDSERHFRILADSELQDKIDSEHEWNEREHKTLDYMLAVTRKVLQKNIDIEAATRALEDSEEHKWNEFEHDALNQLVADTIKWVEEEMAKEVKTRSEWDEHLDDKIDSEHAFNVKEHAAISTLLANEITRATTREDAIETDLHDNYYTKDNLDDAIGQTPRGTLPALQQRVLKGDNLDIGADEKTIHAIDSRPNSTGKYISVEYDPATITTHTPTFTINSTLTSVDPVEISNTGIVSVKYDNTTVKLDANGKLHNTNVDLTDSITHPAGTSVSLTDVVPAATSPTNKLINNDDLWTELTKFKAGEAIDATKFDIAAGKADIDVLYDNKTVKLKLPENQLYASDVDLAGDVVGADVTLRDIVPNTAGKRADGTINELVDLDTLQQKLDESLGTYKGEFEGATQAEAEAKLPTTGVGNNDYANLKIIDGAGNVIYMRYKYVIDTAAGTRGWQYEYTYNHTLTVPQWNAINSGVADGNWQKKIINGANVTFDTDEKTLNVKNTEYNAGTGIDITPGSTDPYNPTFTVSSKLTASSGLQLVGDDMRHTNNVAGNTTGIGGVTKAVTIKYDTNGHITDVTDADMYPPTTTGSTGQLYTSNGTGGEWKSPETAITGTDQLKVPSEKAVVDYLNGNYFKKTDFSATLPATFTNGVVAVKYDNDTIKLNADGEITAHKHNNLPTLEKIPAPGIGDNNKAILWDQTAGAFKYGDAGLVDDIIIEDHGTIVGTDKNAIIPLTSSTKFGVAKIADTSITAVDGAIRVTYPIPNPASAGTGTVLTRTADGSGVMWTTDVPLYKNDFRLYPLDTTSTDKVYSIKSTMDAIEDAKLTFHDALVQTNKDVNLVVDTNTLLNNTDLSVRLDTGNGDLKADANGIFSTVQFSANEFTHNNEVGQKDGTRVMDTVHIKTDNVTTEIDAATGLRAKDLHINLPGTLKLSDVLPNGLVDKTDPAHNRLIAEDDLYTAIAQNSGKFQGQYDGANENDSSAIEAAKPFVAGSTAVQNNDYAVLRVADAATGTVKFVRYKMVVNDPANPTSGVWTKEYIISTEFTASQWSAINSGITTTKVTAYDAHLTDTNMHVTAAEKVTWNGKQDVISAGDNTITITGNAIKGNYQATAPIDITGNTISLNYDTDTLKLDATELAVKTPLPASTVADAGKQLQVNAAGNAEWVSVAAGGVQSITSTDGTVIPTTAGTNVNLSVRTATPTDLGIVKYDNTSINKNANGQLQQVAYVDAEKLLSFEITSTGPKAKFNYIDYRFEVDPTYGFTLKTDGSNAIGTDTNGVRLYYNTDQFFVDGDGELNIYLDQDTIGYSDTNDIAVRYDKTTMEVTGTGANQGISPKGYTQLLADVAQLKTDLAAALARITALENDKQDKLTAGPGIDITGTKISADIDTTDVKFTDATDAGKISLVNHHLSGTGAPTAALGVNEDIYIEL